MSKVIETIKLVFSEVATNNNKWWKAELFNDDTVVTTWGRIGEGTQSKTFPNAGKSFFEKKRREKEKKGYSPLRTVDADSLSTTVAAPTSDLQAIAREQLAKSNPILSKLIDRLVAANIHNIVSQTSITYNTVTGLFQTPLGVIVQDAIDEARNLLVEIKKGLIKKGELGKLVSQYLRIIPHDVGVKLTVESVFPDLGAVDKEANILDSLESSLKAMVDAPAKTDTSAKVVPEKVFDVELDVLNDAQEQRRLEDFYHKSMKSMHGYGHIKIRQMYNVSIGGMKRQFDTKLGNNVEVYHGTSQANLLSIFKSGIKTAPPSTAFIAGKMFGNGTYGAINSSKSLGYTFGRWGGSAVKDSGWLFVCDFAMGKVHEPTRTCYGPPSGYDSVWAKAHKVHLNHDELIVYRDNQVNIKYLLECK